MHASNLIACTDRMKALEEFFRVIDAVKPRGMNECMMDMSSLS